MKHTILTIITEVDPVKKPLLEKLLEQVRLGQADKPLISFPSITLLHFASFVISGNNPSLLVFENNFDGEVSPYLDELLAVAGDGIHQIYQCCTAYKETTLQPATLKQFLQQHIVKPNAYHIGNVGRKAKVVKANQALREDLQSYLDQLFKLSNPVNLSALQLREKMQEYAKANINPELYQSLPPHQTFLEKFMPRFWQALTIAVLLVITFGYLPLSFCVVLGILILITAVLRYKEEHDSKKIPTPSVADIELFIKTENVITQNHLANITDIKPGLFRLVLLKAVLFGANLLARTSTKGKLSGIPSIHFAHWSIINHNTQLLFLSNYDGSWSSYLDDFIDKAAKGLTGIWSNTGGFPHTRFLLWDGARDEIRFKAFARNHQVPSLVWYSAYSDLTVQNIDKDSKIRENLFGTLTEAETKEWLKLF